MVKNYDRFREKYSFYDNQIFRKIKEFMPDKHKILDIGCGTGRTLDILCPSYGVGIDTDEKMIEVAKKIENPNLYFYLTDIKHFNKTDFDYVIMIGLIEHLPDLDKFFESLKKFKSRFIIITGNPRYWLFFKILEFFRLKNPEGKFGEEFFGWVSPKISQSLIKKYNFEYIQGGVINYGILYYIVFENKEASSK